MNWKALLLLAAGHFTTDINTGALPAYLPFIKNSLHLSYTMTATIILVFNITSSVIQPAFGFLSDRCSMRWLLPASPFVAALGLGLLGLGGSYGWVLTFAAISGMGMASYHPEAFKTVGYLAGKKKATMFSFFHVGGNLGFSVGPILATLFFATFGLPGSILFLIPGIGLVVLFFFSPSWKVEGAARGGKAKGTDPSASPNAPFPMFLLVAVVVLRSAARLGIMTFVPLYFINILHNDPLITGKYLSAFLFSGVVGILAGGELADRFGYKLITLVGLGASPIFLGIFYGTNGIVSLFFFSLAGMTLISSNSVTMAMGQSFMPRNPGMASGLILGLAQGIGGVAATIFGWVADQWGVPLALQIIFVLPFLAFLVCLCVPYPRKEGPAMGTPA
jgi:MFS transporter, FSR family, fosmidomycin resistance protein